MRAPLAIALVALTGLTCTPAAMAVPGADDTRSRIRVLEQRVIDANREIPAARRAEAAAALRVERARTRLASVERRLDQRASALSR